MRRLFLSILILLAAVVGGRAADGWESTQKPSSAGVEVIERGDQDSPSIWVEGRYIYIQTPKPVTVKIFSILGQLVSQENVPTGTHRLQLSSRGIYILKVGSITRRLTL